MFSLPRFSIKRPVCIFICIASLIIFGVSSVFQMPMESTPEMEFPVLMVMTSYYGASPEEIDESVTDRVEAALATVSEVQTTMSVSYENMGMTMLQFDYGADLDKKFQDVSSALALVSLPDGASDPTVLELNISNIANSSVMTITVEADAGSNLKAYVEDTVVPELERIEGVSDVSVSGGTREYVQVLLDENKLTQYHLTMSSIANAIASAEFETTLGALDRGNVTVGLTGSQEIANYRALEDVPITLASGDVIRLSDVAQVNLADEEATSYSRRDGKDIISVSVTKEQSANTVEICRQASALVDRLNQSNLGLAMEVTYNSGEDITDNLSNVAVSLVEGLAIAVVVLWIFLGEWKASLIIGLSMPFSVLATLILMALMGMSINLISLGGLVIGIGMLVDNSIVVLDSCFKSGTIERTFEENVTKGAELVMGSIVASTLTTVVVFLPIGMMEGLAGQLFRDICYTIVFSLTASLISALTLVPLLFVKMRPREKTDFLGNRLVRRLEAWYGGVMAKLFDRRRLVVLTAVALVVVALVLYTAVPQELIPDMSSGQIQLSVETKNGLNLESTNEIMSRLEEMVSSQPDVESYTMSVGSGSGITSMMGGGTGSITVTLRDDASMTDDEFVQTIRELSKSVPNCSVDVSTVSMMSMLSGGTVEVNLQGGNLSDLEEQAEVIRDRMAAMPEFDSVTTSLSDGAPRAEIVVDPVLAASVNMTPATVLSSVRSQLSGVEATTLMDSGTEYSVMVELPTDRFQDVSDLYGMMVDTPTGGKAALTDMAEIIYAEAPTSITRQDGDYLVTVTGTPQVGLNTAELSARVMADIAQNVELPEGVEIAQGTSMDQMYEEFAAIGQALLVAIYLVFAVMAIQFESVRFSLVVMISVPFALVGSILGLAITGSSINMASLLGVVMLVGMVVNNAIVLIDYTNILRRDYNMEVRQALRQAGISRLRPILMSTLTTIVGLIPMAVGSDVEMMESMAVVVIGGLTMSTLLTLVLIPTFYLIFDPEDRRRRREARRAAKETAKAGQ